MPERIGRLLFWGPLLVVMGGLLGYPLVSDVRLSVLGVKLSNFTQNPPFVGLDNYRNVLTSGSFWSSLSFSLRFASAATLVEMTLGLAIALFFWYQFRSSRLVVSLMLLPMMTAPSLLAIMFRLMLNDFIGVIPTYMRLLGLPDIPFLGPGWVIRTLLAIDAVQWTPFVFLLLYTGLQALPEDIVEAAQVDGAGLWQLTMRIVLPQLGAVLVATAFLRFIDTFRIFDSIYVLTGGGPGEMTTSASIYIYKQAFGNGELGIGIAAAVLLLACLVVPVSVATGRIFRVESGVSS